MSDNELVALSSVLASGKPVFELTVGSTPMRVVSFSGTEELSALFDFKVEVAGLDFDPEALLGQPALLTLHGAELPRLVHGLVAEAEYVGYTRSLQLYELRIVPWAHRLAHREDCRVFQDKTTEQIVTEVLTGAGLARDWFRFALAESYAPRNYCVQYRETDLDFVTRLLEEDGVFYFFEHDEQKHVWVMADNAQAHTPIKGTSTLWFNPPRGTVQDREHIRTFRFGGRVRPGKVTLRDYNIHKPDLDLEVREAAKVDADLEIYEFPGEYQDPGRGGPHQGQSLAKIRLESLQATRRAGTGDSDCSRLTPGLTLQIAGHPKHELNAEYRLVQVRHTGSQPQVLDQDGEDESSYTNVFSVTELKVPFRPMRRTSRPVMRGVQTATVVGPEGEEVHTDAHGRVRVQFHWDRAGGHDENSATWVRVSQMWAGNGYGTMFLPRIGHEVLIDFIEGDPDRPIIIGRIYHGNNQTPYPLPDEKTKSTIKSESSLGGGGFNELRFEDRKGSEEIFLHAQKDWNTEILNNLTESVGADRNATIGASDSTLVGTVHTVTIAQASSPPPAVPPTGTKMQDTFFSVTTGSAKITINGADVFVEAEGNITLAAGGDITIAAGGTINVVSGGPTSVQASAEALNLKGPLVKINC
ncbi:type VI secretion system Vgr family protein [Nannocystis bainbridge]|uniref:Type VI secretion system tip protein VgrG n=1 Tax=Nannocystis bainbridge TaxID=2995303 RepID=A0ABT5DTP8_9BACT|nr:type VI secretion system tip protein VgrG [Nannocystis bainbridge]MDC0715787.1 type VI secretion system tip protein VgrG [Nannocystis bainbridge]